MEWKVLVSFAMVSIFGLLPKVTNGQIVEDVIPMEITKCVQKMTESQNSSELSYIVTMEDIHTHCLQEFMWTFGDAKWDTVNITQGDKKFVNSLIHSLVRRGRRKRQAGPGGIFPQTGFRIRREYRRLTDGMRFAFHESVRLLKASGQYDIFARMHSGITTFSAHNGPNFPGWHRVYLALFEEALRMVSRGVPIALPYWDSTLDNDMPNPVNSIIWTVPFLGNGNGIVASGPFANWVIDGAQLRRNIGGGSSLFTKEDISRILTRCRNSEILTPTALPNFDLELFHGGPHVWVGGQFAFLSTAAHDPIFFMHHAFVDYIWEMFRIRQARFCVINPETDYPLGPGSANLHAPQRPMDAFPQYRNIDGYRNYWARVWYRYEQSPRCSTFRPFCGTPYLRCDIARQRCVSVERMGPDPVMGAQYGGAADPGTPASNMLARSQESMISAGPKFRAPPAEPRTQDFQMGMAGMAGRRKKREANNAKLANIHESHDLYPIIYHSIYNQFSNISTEKRSNDILNDSVSLDTSDRNIINHAIADGRAFPSSKQLPLLPLPEYHDASINDLFKPHVENDFVINGKADKSQWSFIPVKIIYTKHLENRKDSVLSHVSTFGQRCVQDESGVIQVKVESNGINYYGTYTNYALMDKHLPKENVITYMGIKSPEKHKTKVILSAVHSCGTMCQAHCYAPDSNPPVFQPCTGMLRISANDSNVYGRTIEEIAVRTRGDDHATITATDIRIIFYCSSTENSTWLTNTYANQTKF